MPVCNHHKELESESKNCGCQYCKRRNFRIRGELNFLAFVELKNVRNQFPYQIFFYLVWGPSIISSSFYFFGQFENNEIKFQRFCAEKYEISSKDADQRPQCSSVCVTGDQIYSAVIRLMICIAELIFQAFLQLIYLSSETCHMHMSASHLPLTLSSLSFVSLTLLCIPSLRLFRL